jgi:hypothetical protein
MCGLNRGLAHFISSDLILLLQFLWFFQPVHYEFLTVKILQHEPIHVVRRALDLEETISLHEKTDVNPENDEFHWALANRAEPFTRSYSAPLINASARFVTGKLWRLLHKITRDPTSASPIPRSTPTWRSPSTTTPA